jgi:hypothetical protein
MLTTDQVIALTTDQVSSLSTTVLNALTSTQFQALETADIAVLTSTQFGGLSTSSVRMLTTDQVVALSTYQVSTLSTAALNALTSTQVQALETADIQAISTNQLKALSSTQTNALTSTQVEAFTSSQISAIGTTAYALLTNGSPIILDLNGDGVKTLSINSGVKFDLFAEGGAISTGWVSSGDGLLVLDRNHDGQINDGSELFGTATKLANGQSAPDGYAALRELDSNADGVIDSKDAAFNDLKVWVDGNSDGITEGGELKSLSALNIASINANAQVGTATNNGNLLGLTSTYQTTDGASHQAADVWFLADKGSAAAAASVALTPPTTEANLAAALTWPDGVPAAVANAPLTWPGVDAVAAPAAAPGAAVDPGTTTAMAASGMRVNVSALAQAIGSFTDRTGDPATTGTGLTVPVPSALTPTAVAVVNMVDVMKQFDANGNALGGTVAGASPTTSLTLPGQANLATNGLLTTGGKG